ncbi:DNA excision repair protein ERCC-6-like [Petromyzon marinus]|uniref:DNA excision repair protein ERCC-6-like n=1 Tax=Petromyzon marinus TaxID=7757 RepID=UPI003F72AAAC
MSTSDSSNGRERDTGQMSSGREMGEEEDNPDVVKYRKYVMRSKDALRSENLNAAVHYLRKAYKIYASKKLELKIKALEEVLKAAISSDDEEDEYINVLGSGFNLYHELHNQLYSHQLEGVAWLYNLFKNKRKGGILADDMGLGKTIQVISFLSGMFDASLFGHVLLVMPTTLMSIWISEFDKWAPGITIREFYGTKSERTRNLQKVQRTQGVVITSYQLLVNNWHELSTYQGHEFIWDAMILDEGHKIKTSSTKTAKSAHAIPAHFRMILTGTPVQNNLKEIWALFDFVCEGSLLGTSKTFKMEYENPITKARQKDATVGEKALGTRMAENLQELIGPYFLRRTKAEVQSKELHAKQLRDNKENDPTVGNLDQRIQIEMPTLTRKNDLIVWVYLSPVQEQIYRDFQNLDDIKELLDSTRSPLVALGILKKICVHPRLLPERACAQLGLNQQFGRIESEGLQSNWFLSSIKNVPPKTLIEESGKLTFLIGLLERLRQEGHRTLVFSQSLKMLDIIDHILKHQGFKVMRIDGTITHITEREKRVQTFQKDSAFNVFLLTTQVGGVGLTLTAANRVVILDPSWNPATDAQAVDRAYRIGQTDNVIIYRLVTCGTMEEKIYRRQIFKESLIRQTTGDKKNPFRYFSQQELRELFILEDTKSSKTQIHLQGMHSAQRKSDTTLDEHIAYLHTLDMFGISDHDLMYSCEETNAEDLEEEGVDYIEKRVRKAQEIVAAESQVNQQFRKQILAGTEPPRGLQTHQGTSRDSTRKNKTKPEPEFENEIGSHESLKEPSHIQEEHDVLVISQDMIDLTLEDKADLANLSISNIGALSKKSTMEVEASAFNLVLDKSEEEEEEEEEENAVAVSPAHTTGNVHCDIEINSISMMEEESQSVKSHASSLSHVESDIQSATSELRLAGHSKASFSSASRHEDEDDENIVYVKRTRTRILESSDDDDDDVQEVMSACLKNHEKRRSHTSTPTRATVHGNSSPACEVLAAQVSSKFNRRRSVSFNLSFGKILASDQFGKALEISAEDEDSPIMKMQLSNDVCKDENNLHPCHRGNVVESPTIDSSADVVSYQGKYLESSVSDCESRKNGSATTVDDEPCSLKPMQLDKKFSTEKTPNFNQGSNVKAPKDTRNLGLVSSLLEDEDESPSQQLMGLQVNRLVSETLENTPHSSFSSSASAFNLVLDESEEEEEEEEASAVDVSPERTTGDVNQDTEINSVMENSQSFLKSFTSSLSRVENDIQSVSAASELPLSVQSQGSFSPESINYDEDSIVIVKRTKTRRILESDDDDDDYNDDVEEAMSAILISPIKRQSNASTPIQAIVHGNSLSTNEETDESKLEDRVSKEAFSIGECTKIDPEKNRTAESKHAEAFETLKDSDLNFDLSDFSIEG